MTDDPFEAFADKVPAPTGAKTGYWQRPHDQQSLADAVGDLIDHGDPEKGQGKAQRAKNVDHRARTRKLLESYGYSVTLVETWRTLRGGFSCKLDLWGLWDFSCMKPGHPIMYVQVCAKSGKGAHLRDMCGDKPALDNKKKRIDNLRWCLESGARCILLTWEKQPNGKYASEIIKIDTALVDSIVARSSASRPADWRAISQGSSRA